jgi:hypothetical protein
MKPPRNGIGKPPAARGAKELVLIIRALFKR